MTSRQEREFISIVSDSVKVEIDSSVTDAAIDFIGKNFAPADVFSTSDLENWAESNGYVKEPQA